MMMSMFSSVSGLRSHQTRMDVIGNNIANVNTVGFKGSRSTFQEIFSQTYEGASSPDIATGRGGTNPMQVGLGINVDAIDLMMTAGSVQRTDSPTDLSIEGEGFFIIRSGNEGAYTFTRAGNFTIDRMGNLVTSSGAGVYGWMKYENTDAGYVFDTQEEIRPINLYEDEYNLSKRIIAAQKSTEAILSGNLDSTNKPLLATGTTTEADLYAITDAVDATGAANPDGIPDATGTNVNSQFIVPVNCYDELGNAYKVNITMWKNAVFTGATHTSGAPTPVTSWYYTVNGGENATTGTLPASGYLAFDARGKLITTDPTNFNISPTVSIIPNAETGARAFDVKMDFTQLTMYADDSSVKPLRVDGYPPGTLVTFSVGADGVLTGVYDNGRQQPLGRVGLAVFSNPAGLSKVGANLFMSTSNSGEFTLASTPGSGGAGTLVPGTLEMSNVDLAKQFTEMIITQRGFQANSRVMTTSDEILQELTNMKR
jgi:flagellar hook protein FlgE